MKYGSEIETYYKIYDEMKGTPGFNIPQAIATRPDLCAHDSYYLAAFYTLSKSRQIGMSEGYIPLSETINYGIFLDDGDLDAFVQIIQSLDSFYLGLRAEQAEQKKGSS